MDQRVFGPYYGTPPEARSPRSTIVIAPPAPLRSQTRRQDPRLTKRRLLLAVRQLTKRTAPQNRP
jgi:hypothetical protein